MRRSPVLLAMFAAAAALPAAGQAPRMLTAADYARAQTMLAQSTAALVFGASVRPPWLDGGRFWYRNTIPGGAEFVVEDSD